MWGTLIRHGKGVSGIGRKDRLKYETIISVNNVGSETKRLWTLTILNPKQTIQNSLPPWTILLLCVQIATEEKH